MFQVFSAHSYAVAEAVLARFTAGTCSLILDGGVECRKIIHRAKDNRVALNTEWRALISIL